MFAIIEAAGWPIWPLLFASVIAVALIIERSITLRRQDRSARPAREDRGRISPERVSGDMVNRVAAHSPLGRVLAAGLRSVKSPREVMKESIEEAGRAVVHDMERFLTTLGTIASISPLMGLVRHHRRHDRDLRLAGAFGRQSATTRPWHLDRSLQHRIRVDDRDPEHDLLAPFRALVNAFVIDMEQQAVKLVEVVHGERRN